MNKVKLLVKTFKEKGSAELILKIITRVRKNFYYNSIFLFDKVLMQFPFLLNLTPNQSKVSLAKSELGNFSFNSADISSKNAQLTHDKILCHEFNFFSTHWFSVNKVSTSASRVEGYSKIDWHKDFVTGHTFNQKTWFKHQSISSDAGYDVKRVWELARLQHLPQLLRCTTHLGHLNNISVLEFKNQVCDFYYANPHRWGVNWVSTMEVSIRLINLLIAFDLAKSMDCNSELNEEFVELFNKMVFEHISFIFSNLEVYSGRRNNHYLSNIVALLIGSLYCNPTKYICGIVNFSFNELQNEFDYQFYDDGGNFESSAGYHKLSLELVLTATLLMYKSDWSRFVDSGMLDEVILDAINDRNRITLSQKYLSKLRLSCDYLIKISTHKNESLNYGDNDNGVVLKTSSYWIIKNSPTVLDPLNIESVLDLIKEFYSFAEVEDVTNKNLIACNDSIIIDEDSIQVLDLSKYSLIGELMIPVKLCGQVSFILYKDSGVGLIKSDNLLLSLINTPLGQNGFGGHKHDDYLSFELFNDTWKVRDPGTCTYTENSSLRNKFRSHIVHNGPFLKNQRRLKFLSLFESEATVSQTLNIKNDTLFGTVTDGKYTIAREVSVSHGYIKIRDYSNSEECSSPLETFQFSTFSHTYGRVDEL